MKEEKYVDANEVAGYFKIFHTTELNKFYIRTAIINRPKPMFTEITKQQAEDLASKYGVEIFKKKSLWKEG